MTFSDDALLAQVRRLGPVTGLWVAYSGGLDSSVLLHALVHLRDALALRLEAIHVDHGLLRQAKDWRAHCAATCAALEVPLRVLEVEVAPRRAALGVEAAAREARYAAFGAVLEPGECLLTAHHQDDQAETLLLQLFRGSGPAGLAAMPAVAPLGRGRLARPLLDVARSELRAYAAARAIRFVEDPSNADLRLARSFLRTQVMPRLEVHWPGIRRTLVRAARHAADAAAIVAERAAEDLAALSSPTPWLMPAAALAALPPPRRRAVLRHWCQARGIAAPDTARLDEVLAQLAAARADRSIAVEWPGGAFRRYREWLFLSPGLPAHDPHARLSWEGASPFALPSGLGTLRLVPGGPLRRELLAGRIEVRFRTAGQHCAPAGRAGHHDLKHLFQEAGVPPWLRDRIPLIVVDGELAAIADRWVCGAWARDGTGSGLSIVWDRPDHLDVWTSTPAPGPVDGGLL
jgi:tRNA(Ile)-lysidine synthase